ncbi:hypothetical protein [Streptomyces rhizosphaerihabitans]|uniref:hypothetical protein n=1 Tax=Streptomyces rhizosphaerihabitans TaxID=1266770 RepID=UPI0021C0BB73|nr:hypothetical protein [Streptomyces rhizosphaerihabitans]MCT9006216.1 hypothetical protein [Streptomyces rhizosphaerihabitans]
MAVEQLPGQVLEFARYLNGLVDRLDRGGGWCGVFWQRDPDGMRACLEGWEVPPWDVVEALLQDVLAEYGERAAAQETRRARVLHGASLAAYDARPGGRDALGDRLDVMLREQRYAAERQAELNRLLPSAASREEAEAIRLDLAWAQDDHERATARCTELRHRMDDVDRRALRTRAQGALSFPAPATGDAVWPRQPENWAEPSEGDPPEGGLYEGRPSEGDPSEWDQSSGGPTETGGARRGPEAGTPGVRSGADAYATHAGREGPYAGREGGGPGREVGGAPGVLRRQGRAYDPTTRPEDAYAPAGHADGSRPAPERPAPPPEHPAPPAPEQRSKLRPRGSARFAGMTAPESAPMAVPETAPVPPAPPAPPAHGRRAPRPRGSARFAGMTAPDPAPAAAPQTAPVSPAPPSQGGRTPRGARFAGAAEEPAPPRTTTETESPDEGARQLTAEIVGALTRLRSEGRSGEAHALLVEAAYWPPARFPLLAAELHRAGLDADWATLLWEAASLPADRLVAAADALTASGRTADGRQMLRQGVTRPAPEIGAAVLGLADEGRGREIGALLDAYVRVRTPEEAARSAETDPQRLVPLLLKAAGSVSDECQWDLVHALRVAGFTA